MKLKKLRLKNFRSFADSEVLFPDSGLVLLRGSNPSTGGSSMTGKSSLLLGVAYALDILPSKFPATKLQSWHGDEPMQVELEFEVNNQTYTVIRGKKTVLKTPSGNVTSAKGVSEALVGLVGSVEVLKSLTHRPQRSPGLFLARPAAAKAEFLTEILGLQAIEIQIEKSKAKASTLQAEISVLQSSLERALAVKKELEAHPPQTPRSNELSRDDFNEKKQEFVSHSKKIKELQKKLTVLKTAASDTVEAEVRGHETEIKEAKGFIVLMEAEEKRKAAEVQKALEGLNRHRSQIESSLAIASQAEAQIPGLRLSLEKLRSQKCPTCSQEWLKSENEAKAVELKIAECLRLSEGKVQLAQVLQDTKDKQSEAGKTLERDPRLAKLVEVVSSLQVRAAEARARGRTSPEIEVCEQELQTITKEHQKLEVEVRTMDSLFSQEEGRNKADMDALERYKASLAEHTQSAVDAALAIEKVRKSLSLEQEFQAAMGRDGFLGSVFQDVLEEISVEANEKLSRLANVSHVTIDFKTERETQKGEIKRAVTTVVYVNGVETDFDAGLSGGGQSSVELVVDLAVMSVIERRSGRVPGWLCLDEVFNGQDGPTKEAAVEVLKEYANDKLILVVDHSEEFKQIFTSTIDIVCENGVSSIA